MKTTLFSVLLLTSTVGIAQPSRTRENTNGSWNNPNLSVENWDGRNWIIAGTTEASTAGNLCPTFKFTDPNLSPIVMAPLPTYRTNFGLSKTLNDFTVNQNTGHIILTGTDPLNSTGAPLKMYIAVVNGPTGALVGSVQVVDPNPTVSLVPSQVIYSATANQYVIVGTKITGALSATNYLTVPKTGFMLIVNAALPFAVVNFIETNSPGITGGNDSDLLESVTEIPGYGYFAGGSANGFANPSEQNAMVMNANYAGAPGPTTTIDNTSSRSVVSSVMHNPATNRVIVLNNNSSFTGYELLSFNAVPVAPVFPAVRHTLACIPSTARANGFRLQQNTPGTQIIVGGYVWNPSSTAAQLTPFQSTTNPNLGTFINSKLFQSANNSALTGIYTESGAPTFFNTPDMLSYHSASNRTFLVNSNSNFGFDMLRSSPTATLACETPCNFVAASTQWPVASNVSYITSSPAIPNLFASLQTRTLMNTVLCSSTPMAPFDGGDHAVQGTLGVKLFPNPAQKELEIESESTIVEAIVYDLNGKSVLTAMNDQHARGTLLIDISSLKTGAYIIQLKDAAGNVQRERFVKE
jgi:hypothetical protein